MTTTGSSGTYLYMPLYGAQGSEEYSAFDAGLSAADSALVSATSATIIKTTIYATTVTATTGNITTVNATTVTGTTVTFSTVNAVSVLSASTVDCTGSATLRGVTAAAGISATAITAASLSAGTVSVVTGTFTGVTEAAGISATAVTAASLSAGTFATPFSECVGVSATAITAAAISSSNINSPIINSTTVTGTTGTFGTVNITSTLSSNGTQVYTKTYDVNTIRTTRTLGLCATTDGTVTSAAYVPISSTTSAGFIEAFVTAHCTAGMAAPSAAAFVVRGSVDHTGAVVSTSTTPFTATAALSAYVASLVPGVGQVGLTVTGSADHIVIWGYDITYVILG